MRPPPPLEQREWLSSVEVATHFGRTRQAVDIVADSGKLPHDVVMRGTKKERRFPKAEIEAIERLAGLRDTSASGIGR